MASARQQKELETKARLALATTKDPLERLRAACLARGAQGIKGLSILFRVMDDDGNRKLSVDEFKKGVEEYGLNLSKTEIEDLFRAMDADRNGSIDYEEFLRRLRPPMNNFRLDLIAKAFAKLDRNHDGQITVEDLRGIYNVKNHPKYMNGTWSEDEVLRNFLDCFDYGTHKDGIVTRDEFFDYYSGWKRHEGSIDDETKRIRLAMDSHSWYKQSTLFAIGEYNFRNQNAVGSQSSPDEDASLPDKKKNPQSTDASSLINFTNASAVELRINTNNQLEKIDSHGSDEPVIITRRHSKPSRHDSIQKITSEIREHQLQRYRNYQNRLTEHALYSLMISANGIECYGTNYEPSVFTTSYRCRTSEFEALRSINDQDIKPNASYISLDNLLDLIDHEPNVSRKNSFARSSSHILMHKPSLFLADIFNKMTHEQRSRSIVELAKLHDHLTKSNTAINKLQRTTSLPNLNKTATRLHSVTSLVTEEPKTDVSLNESHLKTPADQRKTNLNKENATDYKIRTSKQTAQLAHMDNSSATSSIIPSTTTHLPAVKLSPISTKSADVAKVNEAHTQKFPPKASESTPHSIFFSSTPPSFHIPLLKNDGTLEINLTYVTHHLFQKDTAIPSSNDETTFGFARMSSKLKDTVLPSTSEDIAAKSEALTAPPNTTDDNTSRTTQLTTASTIRTITENTNNDGEQLKRSSLGLARDSLELLRNNTPHRRTSDEQLRSPPSNADHTPRKHKSVLKPRIMSSDALLTPKLISYIDVGQFKDDEYSREQQIQRRSLTMEDGGIIISCTSPKPKRDSLTLLQQYHSEIVSSRSGRYHLSNYDDKHVEFIREPGNTITPVLHKYLLHKHVNPTFCNGYCHHILYSMHDASERSKSETSLVNHQCNIDVDSRTRCLSPNTTSRPHTSQISLTSIAMPRIETDEEVYLTKKDYDRMVHLIVTSLLKKKK
ncbi:unnamed protein product [Adineta ricciae]|uniref:EF-hand domain-containing protein n=1 Tax=Adineta ricciae TaxID=249248 RepID=A0A814IXX8_ADIRI|nr:unnamed protein product [Adineta ricciae]